MESKSYYTILSETMEEEREEALQNWTDPFRFDPIFESEEDLTNFLETNSVEDQRKNDGECDGEMVDSEEVECSCNNCVEIFDARETKHKCCIKLVEKWKAKLEPDEKDVKCVIDTIAFRAVTNPHAIRTTEALLDKNKKETLDPPTNSNLRYACYRSIYVFLFGKSEERIKRKRERLPACVMKVVREMYPEDDNIFVGFKEKTK